MSERPTCKEGTESQAKNGNEGCHESEVSEACPLFEACVRRKAVRRVKCTRERHETKSLGGSNPRTFRRQSVLGVHPKAGSQKADADTKATAKKAAAEKAGADIAPDEKASV